jgi:hypothetical protein
MPGSPSQSAFADIGSAVKDLFGGIGEAASAKGYSAAAGYARENAAISAQSTKIQEVQAQRKIWQVLGGQQADIAGAGLMNSGSALDIARSSAQQGALTKQLIANQGAINVLGYQEEAANYSAMATAATASSKGSFLSSAVEVAAAIFSDDALKENPVLVARRPDGLGIYEFNYRGSAQRFKGVMASEVEVLYPTAVTLENGYRKVDYEKIGVIPEVANG